MSEFEPAAPAPRLSAVDRPTSHGGFDFSNCARNTALEATAAAAGEKLLASKWKTGTTICGVMYNGGIVLGADTRATSGDTVASKNCEKLHYLAPNIFCAGAGTAADLDKQTEMMASTLELQVRATAATLLLSLLLLLPPRATAHAHATHSLTHSLLSSSCSPASAATSRAAGRARITLPA